MLRRDLLEVVVRLHTTQNLGELGRCLFSLACQSYAPLRVLLVTQRFDEAQLQAVEALAAPYRQLNPHLRVAVFNRADASPKDARAALMNFAIARCEGRYLAFLDYDDVIYENGYASLVRTLQNSNVAIAFGNVFVRVCDAQDSVLLTRKKCAIFPADHSLLDLFRANHCPIHSFVIDRTAVHPRALRFDESLNRLEDYDLLLRLCATYPSCFSAKRTYVGDYYMKNDGSNSTASSAVDSDEADNVHWRQARGHIDRLKAQLVVSSPVQARLGLEHTGHRLKLRDLAHLHH